MRHWFVQRSFGVGVWLSIGVILASLLTFPVEPAESRERNRTLRLYFGHTKERGEFTFKRNGRYDRGELRKINQFLRDWRRNEPADMDPKLLDLIWSIYQETGSREYIHVVSAYRSRATNNALRARSNGVAEKSQHTAGKAMDFYIPGVPLAKLRGIAMKHQGGGVGFYPTSGSPFVHVDTGNVRSWPRMSRQQLLALFPNGETLYLPADGKPLPGYQRALARRQSSGGTALAYLETGSESETDRTGGNGTVGGWLKRVFDGGADEAEDSEVAAAPPAAPAPAQPAEPIEAVPSEPGVLVADAEVESPRLPRARPAGVADLSLAALAPEAPATLVVPEDGAALAALSGAPGPGAGPNYAVLEESLQPQSGPEPLALPEPDAIATLALSPDAAPPSSPAAADVPVELALADPEASSEAPTGSALEAVDAFGSGRPVPLPRPRPVEVAYAPTGLNLDEMRFEPIDDTAATAINEADRAALLERALASLPAAPAQIAVSNKAPSPAPASADPGSLVTRFAMPQPAPGLFAPASAATPTGLASNSPLQGGTFRPAPATEAPEESFLSRLFASLAE